MTVSGDEKDTVEWFDYIAKTLGTKNWVMSRKTKHNLALYDVCISHSRYQSIQRQYLKDGGDPEEIYDDRLCEECGWVRIAPGAAVV